MKTSPTCLSVLLNREPAQETVLALVGEGVGTEVGLRVGGAVGCVVAVGWAEGGKEGVARAGGRGLGSLGAEDGSWSHG